MLARLRYARGSNRASLPNVARFRVRLNVIEPRRHTQWTLRLGRLNAAVKRRTDLRDYDGAGKALRVLRSAYDYWARECFGVRAVQAQAQSDARDLANSFRL